MNLVSLYLSYCFLHSFEVHYERETVMIDRKVSEVELSTEENVFEFYCPVHVDPGDKIKLSFYEDGRFKSFEIHAGDTQLRKFRIRGG